MHPELFKIPWINMTMPSWGAMLGLGFILGTLWMTIRAKRVKADPDIVINLAIIALIFSLVGARAFYVIHYWEQFANHPDQIFSLGGTMRGFEIYGGLIGAMLTTVLYLRLKGLSIRLYADLAAPSILLGMGLGRIGCYLFGCCWGAECSPNLPWAANFPYGSPPHQQQWVDRQASLPAELLLIDQGGGVVPVPQPVLKLDKEKVEELQNRLQEAAQAFVDAKESGDAEATRKAQIAWTHLELGLGTVFGHFDKFGLGPEALSLMAADPVHGPRSVHPTQLYSAIGLFLLTWLTGVYFYRRQRHGTVMVVGMMVYAVFRFFEEIIRVDNPQDTFGLTVSQGVSIVFFAVGVALMVALQQMPLRSPRPAVPPPRSKPAKTEPTTDTEPADPTPDA